MLINKYKNEKFWKYIRNIIIYIIGVYLLSIIGGMIQAGGNGAGGLVFIIGPILMMVLLRLFGGDGWRDAGLKLNLKRSWGWYLFSLLIFPIIFMVTIALGIICGVIILAVVYGQIRKKSNTVWSVVLLHGISNTIAWAVNDSNLININNKVLANITPESVFGIVLWGLAACYLLVQLESRPPLFTNDH